MVEVQNSEVQETNYGKIVIGTYVLKEQRDFCDIEDNTWWNATQVLLKVR